MSLSSEHRANRAALSIASWLCTVISVTYGLAKLTGAQFTVLDSELAKPLGEVSGFWLTWHYFGYSPWYGSLIALFQIGSGLLLAIPRTRLLGALLLFPVALNIVLVDVAYRIDIGATVVAVTLLTCVSFILAAHLPRLAPALLLPATSRSFLGGRRRLAVLTALVLATTAFTYWVANYNNRKPTSIDGRWTVAEVSGPGEPWEDVFFERNRAHLAVFRRDGAEDVSRHFELDDAGQIRVWERWLQKGRLLLEGRVTAEQVMELRGIQDSTYVLRLTKRRRD